jgi:6-phosphogluconolactonase
MRKSLFFPIGLMTTLTAIPVIATERTAAELVYVGTRGTAADAQVAAPPGQTAGPSGIYAVRLDTATGNLSLIGHVAQLDRAQWLSPHPRLPVIYAVAGAAGGLNVDSDIHSFAVDAKTGALTELNKTGSGGRDATHLAIDAASATLFTANHGSATGSSPPLFSGSVSAIALQANGSLDKVTTSLQESGSGPHPQRQRNAATHGVAIDPSRRFVLTADLGADRLFIYRFDRAKRALTPTGAEVLPAGSGPRHLLFHPNGKWLFVNTELSAELHVFQWDANKGQLHRLQSLDAYPANYAGKDEKSSAELELSSDGRFLYLSLRGDQNSIVVYAIGRAGTLTEIQRIASGGQGSRSFAIDPTGRWLLVANDTDTLTELMVNRATGMLSTTDHSLAIPKPAAVSFYPR